MSHANIVIAAKPGSWPLLAVRCIIFLPHLIILCMTIADHWCRCLTVWSVTIAGHVNITNLMLISTLANTLILLLLCLVGWPSVVRTRYCS
jgi:hypothetical protein